MKRNVFLWAGLLTGLCVLASCEKDEDGDDNDMDVTITHPETSSVWMQGDVIEIGAEVEEGDEAVWGVEFYVGGDLLAADSVPPYEAAWESTDTASLGDYALYAIAKSVGDESIYRSVTVRINTEGGLNPDLEYGSMTDGEGNNYPTILIGEQEWMAENLRSTYFADGSSIPLVSDTSEWSDLEADALAYCWYNNADTMDGYGALYTWEAAQAVCPEGWHLPTDEEWMVLELSLGMEEDDANKLEWRGTDTGNLLKEVGYTHWEYDNEGNNESGFTALPAGFRSHSGSFYSHYAYYWAASEDSNTVLGMYRSLLYDQSGVFRGSARKQSALSVRCLKD